MVEATHQLQIFTKYEYKCTTHNTIEERGALPCKALGDLVIQMSRSSSACIGGKNNRSVKHGVGTDEER